MSVPDTTTFRMSDVVAEVGGDLPSLSLLFRDANQDGFDPLYVGLQDRLLNFRNYNHSPAPPFPETGLIHYWALDEEFGDISVDSKGANDLTLQNSVIRVSAGKLGYGVNSIAETVPVSTTYMGSADMSLSHPISFSFWIKAIPGWDNPGNHFLFCAGEAGTQSKYGGVNIQLNTTSSPKRLTVLLGTDGGIDASDRRSYYFPHPCDFSSTDWVHVVVTSDGQPSASGQKVWFNSIPQVLESETGTLNLIVWPRNNKNPRFFCGSGGNLSELPFVPAAWAVGLDEIAIFNTIISQADVDTIYNGGSGSFYRP